MPHNRLTINFIGSFTTGYVGEVADEVHLARELEELGHVVNRVPRDQWHGYVNGDVPQADWVLPKVADINIVCKWHHFNDAKYFDRLREHSEAKVLYWVWDHMDYNEDGFHYIMSKAADLLLTNDGFGRVPSEIKWQYFPFDVADSYIPTFTGTKNNDVVFFGTKLGQGDRVEWLTYLNKHHPVKIFSWNYKEWQDLGFEAHPAVYGERFNDEVSQAKIVMGFNVNDHTWGYWSNRVGKVLLAGGFLLQRYVPGMELFLRDGVDYFSSKHEMVSQVTHYLHHPLTAAMVARRGHRIAQERFSSKARIIDLNILIDRFLNGGI
jgi:hypothetical protein